MVLEAAKKGVRMTKTIEIGENLECLIVFLAFFAMIILINIYGN